MIDYHAHVAGLEKVQEELDAAVSGSGHEDAWAETKAALDAEPACAVLGALLDHLLERSEGARPEHDLLEEGSALYGEAAGVLANFADLRDKFEKLVDESREDPPANAGQEPTPSSAPLVEFSALKAQLKTLQPKLEGLRKRFEAFQPKLFPPFRHVAGHAIAEEEPVASWLWRDVILSRRTDALVSALHGANDGSPATLAFSFGALSGYATNCIGSSYLSQVVGGPRRSHPIRDRIARYSVGAWLRKNEPALCPSLNDLRTRATSGNPLAPKLPNAVRDQLTAAFAATFPAGSLGAVPDLDEGYASLLRHLELLESFPRQPEPPDIRASLFVPIMQSTNQSVKDAQTKPQTARDPFSEDPPDPTLPPAQPTMPGQETTGGDGGCLLAIAIIVLALTIIGIIIYISNQDEAESPDEATATGLSESELKAAAIKLEAFLGSDEALIMVSGFYHAHSMLHTAMVIGRDNLARAGLVYPDEVDLLTSTFRQFTSLQASGGDTTYPHRPMPHADVGYLDMPSSPIEEPGTRPSRYPAGATPNVFLHGAPGGLFPTVGATGAELWLKHRDSPNNSDGDRDNLNCDADRGEDHPCWRVSPDSSLGAQPVRVEILDYSDLD